MVLVWARVERLTPLKRVMSVAEGVYMLSYPTNALTSTLPQEDQMRR